MTLAEIEIRAALDAIANRTFSTWTIAQRDRMFAALDEAPPVAVDSVVREFLREQARSVLQTKQSLLTAQRDALLEQIAGQPGRTLQ